MCSASNYKVLAKIDTVKERELRELDVVALSVEYTGAQLKMMQVELIQHHLLIFIKQKAGGAVVTVCILYMFAQM